MHADFFSTGSSKRRSISGRDCPRTVIKYRPSHQSPTVNGSSTSSRGSQSPEKRPNARLRRKRVRPSLKKFAVHPLRGPWKRHANKPPSPTRLSRMNRSHANESCRLSAPQALTSQAQDRRRSLSSKKSEKRRAAEARPILFETEIPHVRIRRTRFAPLRRHPGRPRVPLRRRPGTTAEARSQRGR